MARYTTIAGWFQSFSDPEDTARYETEISSLSKIGRAVHDQIVSSVAELVADKPDHEVVELLNAGLDHVVFVTAAGDSPTDFELGALDGLRAEILRRGAIKSREEFADALEGATI